MGSTITRSHLSVGSAGRHDGLLGFILVISALGVFVLWRGPNIEHFARVPPESTQEHNFQFQQTSPNVHPVSLPDVPSLRAHEAGLPQQNEQNARAGRFVRFQSQHHWGVGFNNLWQEFILLATIAEQSGRSYVFRDLVRARRALTWSNLIILTMFARRCSQTRARRRSLAWLRVLSLEVRAIGQTTRRLQSLMTGMRKSPVRQTKFGTSTPTKSGKSLRFLRKRRGMSWLRSGPLS